MNELRRLSHLASVWIIRYCYSCGASRCAQPQAMWESWMTVKKDSDKLIDFCEGVKRHSEGSFIDGCARCLLGDARDILVSYEGCFSAQGPRPCQDYRKMMWIRFGDRFYFLPGFCSGKAVWVLFGKSSLLYRPHREERVHITWPEQKPGHTRIPARLYGITPRCADDMRHRVRHLSTSWPYVQWTETYVLLPHSTSIYPYISSKNQPEMADSGVGATELSYSCVFSLQSQDRRDYPMWGFPDLLISIHLSFYIKIYLYGCICRYIKYTSQSHYV